LPVDIIYELFNLNSDEIDSKVYEDLFTVKDATFNRMIEEINGEVGRALVERTDVAEKVAKYLGLAYQKPVEEGEGGGFGGDFGGGGFGDESSSFGQDEPAPDEGGVALSDDEQEAIADSVVEALPEGASDEEIEKVVDEVGAGIGE